jgi:hypothetical protein
MTFPVNVPANLSPSRQALNDALSAILAAFMTAQPTVVRRYWSELPASLNGEAAFVYQGPINETITHDAGTRSTVFRGSLGYVDYIADPEETNTRCNTFADFMREWFTANYHILVNTSSGPYYGILEQTALIDGPTELVQGSTRMTDVRLEFTFNPLEGRDTSLAVVP